MASLFEKKAAVDYIPTEKDVDPELLEENPSQDKGNTQDYRDSNDEQRGSTNGITGSVIAQVDTELIIRRLPAGRSHVALKLAGAKTVIASWWDEHVTAAIASGDLDPSAMHTSAYRYAAKHGLLPCITPTSELTVGKKAALFNKPLTLTYVDPDGPGWAGFVEKLRNLPQGSKIQTQDGYVLTKDGNTFGDGDVLFALEDFDGAKDNLMPAMAIKQAAEDKTFVGQHREDGSWSLEQVDPLVGELQAEAIKDSPDGNDANLLTAPDGEAARLQLYEKMTAQGETPQEPTGIIRPTASVVLKAGDNYLRIDKETLTASLVVKQHEATKFATKQAAVVWKASSTVLEAAMDQDVRVITLKSVV